jgi:ABC-type bacteriocin/lantibiotic exporter with double-glycine peptidase domain
VTIDAAPAQSTLATVRAFYRAMSPARRRQFRLVVPIMLLGALAETVTIGAVLPFLALLADPARGARLPGFRLLEAMGGGQSGDLMMRATLLLVAAIVAAAVMRLMIALVTNRFVFALGHEVGLKIFGRMLRQPYSLYASRNPATVVAGIDKVQALISWVLTPVMQGLASSIIALAIIAVLIAIAPATAALAAAAAALIYVGVSYALARRLRANSRSLAENASARAKAVQEALGGLRDILLDHSQDIFEQKFRRLDRAFREAQSSLTIIGSAPRYVLEAVGIVLIGLLALHMSAQPGGMVAAVPVLGALALGAQRLLPLLHSSYLGWTQFSGHLQTLRDVLELMHSPTVTALRVCDPVPFQHEVVLDRVSLIHPGGAQALRDISFRIAKGERVGMVGKTGAGKSSLLDVMMGLLDPTEGDIRIDGRPLDAASRPNWQAQIAHVPQSIYLADESIAFNIAFADADGPIDMARVREAARRAQIHDFIAAAPLGYETTVGDRGVRLSGGQRQQIAIARAFYKRASILILDEATGHLDKETEDAVIAAVSEIDRDITILIVAHRASTLQGCDRILRLDAGRLVES